MRKDLMNNNQHHYLNELNFPTNRDLKNLFGSFYNLLDLPESRDVSSWNNFEPKLEVKENKESVNVTAEIPGMNENDIDLQLSEDGYLTINFPNNGCLYGTFVHKKSLFFQRKKIHLLLFFNISIHNHYYCVYLLHIHL